MRSPVLALLLASMAGCFYPADRGRALEASVARLTEDREVLALRVEESEKRLSGTLPQVEEKIAEVSTALQSLDQASRRSGADIGVQLQKTVEDVASLRGQVEVFLHKIDQLEAELAKLGTETDQKLLALKGEEAVRAAEALRRAEALVKPAEPKAFLALAQKKAQEGELPVARQLFGEFIRRWGKDALVGEAHFGLGETFYAEDKWREALYEYGRVVQAHANTPSAPKAYLRSSDCFQKLKMNAESKLALEELVRSHPESAEAKQAEGQLNKPGTRARRSGGKK